jgi:hypothetical protein
MKAKPNRESIQGSSSNSRAVQPLMPVDCWRSAAMGITAYVFEESETSIRESGLVPEWVHYPSEAGNGVAVPAHHIFPNYLKLLRLENGHLRLVVDARSVLRGDDLFQRFFGALTADDSLSLVRGESA